jgi:cellulose synthase/poly-beta-1,6-N-acetylglucosamine synthase-like glycosyltransferase
MSLFFILFYTASLVMAIIYAGLIFRLVVIWRSMSVFALKESFNPQVFISIIIPARNEAAAIEACLEAIARQNYPSNLYEILVVDDHSSDATVEKVKAFPSSNLRLIHLADHPQLDSLSGFKKQAITWAIEHARGELIVTTDADCIAPPFWLKHLAACYQEHGAKFIAAPVVFSPTTSLLEDFQALDFLGMMLATGAGIQTGWFHLSNGANLAYPKKTFYEVGGFQDIQQIASGDDMLLMHKIIRRYPNNLCFLKTTNATVSTTAQSTLSAFIQQRLRWATKSNSYTDRKVITVLGLIFFFCWAILLSLPAAILWGWPALAAGLVLLSIKATADYQLLSTAAVFFDKQALMRRFWLAQGLHILYITLIGLLANVKKTYEWKGRRVK